MGVFIGVGGVEGHGIWGSVAGVTLQKKVRTQKKERKKNFLKIRNNISEQKKTCFVVLEMNYISREN